MKLKNEREKKKKVMCVGFNRYINILEKPSLAKESVENKDKKNERVKMKKKKLKEGIFYCETHRWNTIFYYWINFLKVRFVV